MTAGYRANRYLAIEVSYVNLGTLDSTFSTVLPPILGGDDVASDADVDGLSLAVLYRL